MGQAGAQREPSMEEILASIRRIIENNEPADAETEAKGADTAPEGRDANGATDEVAAEAPSEPVEEAGTAAKPGAEAVGDEDVGEAEPEPGIVEMYPAAQDRPAPAHSVVSSFAEDSARPVSLAEVAARVREQSDHEPDTAAATDEEETGAVNDDTIAAALRQALVSDEPVTTAKPSQDAVPPLGQAAAADATRTAENAGAGQEAAPPASPDPSPEPVSEAKQLAPVATTESEDARGQLVSLQTGEKVAAAFNELSAAIQAGQARSFDDIAQEMLRPMLTQWLDDNLPTLVERLVREEIERVSRGDRR